MRKRAEREQRHARARLWSNARVVAVVLGAVAVVVAAVVLYRSPVLEVRRYRLVGARQVKLADVLARAQIPAGATLLRFPVSDARDRVAADPWIASVEVRRVLPDTIEFDVVERVPAALLDADRKLWLVDGAGCVLATRSVTPSSTLPVVRRVEGLKPLIGARIASPALANALAVLKGIDPVIRRQVRFIDAPSVDETSLHTSENVDILVGPVDDLAKKDLIVRKILAEQHGKVVFMDVRSTDRVVVRGIGK